MKRIYYMEFIIYNLYIIYYIIRIRHFSLKYDIFYLFNKKLICSFNNHYLSLS